MMTSQPPPSRHRAPATSTKGFTIREVLILSAVVGQWEARIREATRHITDGSESTGVATLRSLADDLAAFQASLIRSSDDR